MRKATLLIFFICMAYTISAQQKIIDSLQNKVKEHPKQDTVKLNLLIDLTFYYKDTDPAKGIETGNEAAQLSKLLNDLKRLAIAYNYTGLNYTAQGNDTTALELFNKSLAIRKQLNDGKGIASVIHNIGISYFNLTNYPLALKYQQEAYEISKKINYQPGIASSLNSTGIIYLYLSEYPKALNNYLESLHIYEQLGDEFKTGSIYSNIGLVYDKLGNYNKALEYQFKAADIFRKFYKPYNLQNVLTNIGNEYDDAGKPLKALPFYKQALTINKKLGNNRGIASNLINTGIVYNGMKNYPEALHYLTRALDLYWKLNDKYGMSIALSYISNSYSRAPVEVLKKEGVAPSQRFAKAINLQMEGLQFAEQIKDLSAESDAWGNLSELYSDKKDFSKALDAYKKHIAIRDSILSNEKRSEITRMAMQYDFDKKEAASKAATDKQQAIADAEIRKQRIVKNAIAGGGAVLLLTAIAIFIFYKRKRDAVEQQKEAEYKLEVADTEMKALRSQMNPHFIFNSLNSISDYIAQHDIKKADYYLAKFAKMMRMILENSEYKQISLADDLKALEIYMQLEALRLNDKFIYEIIVDEQIDQQNTMVPPLILQPFVENSIWHGIAQKEGRGKILIEIKREDELINCIVEDDGIGRNLSTIEEHNARAKKSLGMKITKSRIEIMNRLKKTKGNVELSDLAIGMRVEVRLPLALNF